MGKGGVLLALCCVVLMLCYCGGYTGFHSESEQPGNADSLGTLNLKFLYLNKVTAAKVTLTVPPTGCSAKWFPFRVSVRGWLIPSVAHLCNLTFSPGGSQD